jgi:integrase
MLLAKSCAPCHASPTSLFSPQRAVMAEWRVSRNFGREWPSVELPGDVTPQVLRHSFASLAVDLGYSEPTIATLVGHKRHSVTSRYLHSADAVLLAAADAVANRTAKLMSESRADAAVIPLRREVAG